MKRTNDTCTLWDAVGFVGAVISIIILFSIL